MAAHVPLAHNYALKIPWAETEALPDYGPQYGFDLPRTHILSLFLLYLFQVSFPQIPRGDLIVGPFEGRIHQGGTHVWGNL